VTSNRRDKIGRNGSRPKSGQFQAADQAPPTGRVKATVGIRATGPDKAAGRTPPASQAVNLLIGLTIAAVLLAVLIALGPLTPFLLAAPIVPFYFRAMKAGARGTAFKMAFRWSLTVLVTVSLFAGFLADRTKEAVPFADRTQTAIQSWLTSADGSPPADYLQLVVGLALFGAAAVLSGGAGGFVVGALGLAGSACGAAYLFQRGDNIFHILIVAVPPWLLCLYAAGLFLLVPITIPFFHRMSGRAETGDGLNVQRHIYLGVGLLAGSLLLRLLAAGIWAGLVKRWTIL
jgi:hypothetical protein